MIKKKPTKINLAVTDVSKSASSATLEGEVNNVKYIVLLDYDIFGDVEDEHDLGDQHEMTLVLTKKAKIKPVGGQVAVPGSNVCPGSGKVGHTYKVWPGGYGSGTATWVNDAKCPDCGKQVSLNTPRYSGFSKGSTYESKFRKHKGIATAQTIPGTCCPGTGTKPTGKIIKRNHRYGNDRAVCSHCGKTRMVKYNGTFGKHKP